MGRKQISDPPARGERCHVLDCAAAGVEAGTCFGHLTEIERDDYLGRIAAARLDHRTVDLRGVALTSRTWGAVHAALAKMGRVNRLLLSHASIRGEFNLEGIEVRGRLAADGVDFRGEVHVRSCTFHHSSFVGSQFHDLVKLQSVTFVRRVAFDDCTFSRALFAGERKGGLTLREGATFERASFNAPAGFRLGGGSGEVRFTGTSWASLARFPGVRHEGDLNFAEAHFDGDLVFSNASIDGTLGLVGARLNGLCALEGARVANLSFKRAVFSLAPELGQIAVDEWAVLDQAVFEQQVRLRILAGTLHCHRTIFARGVSMSIVGELVADGSFFPPPSAISGVGDDPAERARIASLRGADVGGLTVSNVDLSGCLFSGAHHLESSRLGASLTFGSPPGRWNSPRDVLAEEQWFRRAADAGSQWWGREQLLPSWLAENRPSPEAPSNLALDPPGLPDPSSIADTYRALRKAREENKDAPGAASFYYGEMEMRRKATARGSGARDLPERVVLGAYWLFSGYGLRAWRSLATLALLLLLTSFLLWKFGFRAAEGPIALRHAARVAVASATSLVRPIDDSELNGVGFGIEIVLRFAGPALLALAALAVRARIKR